MATARAITTANFFGWSMRVGLVAVGGRDLEMVCTEGATEVLACLPSRLELSESPVDHQSSVSTPETDAEK